MYPLLHPKQIKILDWILYPLLLLALEIFRNSVPTFMFLAMKVPALSEKLASRRLRSKLPILSTRLRPPVQTTTQKRLREDDKFPHSHAALERPSKRSRASATGDALLELGTTGDLRVAF